MNKTEEKTKKITKATVKSFIRMNKGNLFLKVESKFDGMTDMCEIQKDNFKPVVYTESNQKNTLGIVGLWVVPGFNSYNNYEDENYIGIEYWNCCGSGIIARKK